MKKSSKKIVKKTPVQKKKTAKKNKKPAKTKAESQNMALKRIISNMKRSVDEVTKPAEEISNILLRLASDEKVNRAELKLIKEHVNKLISNIKDRPISATALVTGPTPEDYVYVGPDPLSVPDNVVPAVEEVAQPETPSETIPSLSVEKSDQVSEEIALPKKESLLPKLKRMFSSKNKPSTP